MFVERNPKVLTTITTTSIKRLTTAERERVRTLSDATMTLPQDPELADHALSPLKKTLSSLHTLLVRKRRAYALP
ncbi:hypothetical protein ABW20_dc0104367 [Dactylellina cionopaga]|nr:hypothetical protein ABW20_dc0104367 [Dactylellina cionopaga]